MLTAVIFTSEFIYLWLRFQIILVLLISLRVDIVSEESFI